MQIYSYKSKFELKIKYLILIIRTRTNFEILTKLMDS